MLYYETKHSPPLLCFYNADDEEFAVSCAITFEKCCYTLKAGAKLLNSVLHESQERYYVTIEQSFICLKSLGSHFKD